MNSTQPVLVVDDNPTNLKLLAFVLRSHGYDVRTAVDAESAMVIVATEPPSLILMDLQLPGIDGFELTRRIKADESTRSIVVVAVTAYAMKGDDRRAFEAGCDGYITKPVDTRTLPGVVADFLASRSGARGRS